MPSTAEVEANVELLKARQEEHGRFTKADKLYPLAPAGAEVIATLIGEKNGLQIKLEMARERDGIQATRPEGCWCLGLGGRNRRMLSPTNEYVFEKHCQCLEGAEAEELDRKLREKAINQRDRIRRDGSWQRANIPKRFFAFTLQSSPLLQTQPSLIAKLTQPETPPDVNDEAAWEAWVAADQTWRGSWFFWGDYGVGKTGLAIGYAREAIKEIEDISDVLFTTVPGLLSQFRSTYNKAEGETEMDVLRRYTNAQLLILDDLGAEQVKGTGWVEDRLYQVIGERHGDAENRWTLFTSNLSLEQLANKIGERICWRILEMCGKEHVIQVQGPNLREALP
ncbi:MAG: ATP-binding protein [Candidatus Brocadiales bacterium]